MKKLFNKFWIVITIILSLIFIGLFLPLTTRSLGFTKAFSYTMTGLAVIWIVYFVRAYIFSDMGHDKSENDQP